MKKHLIWGVPLIALAMLNSGCMFSTNAAKQPEIYDLPVGEEKISIHPLHIGPVRNLSGADRRIQLREDGTRIRQVEDYLWILPPAALLERKLKERFSVQANREKIPALHTLLRYFEFGREKHEAFLGVNYEIIMPDGKKIAISGNYREKIQGERYTHAMEAAIRRSMDDLDAALKKATGK